LRFEVSDGVWHYPHPGLPTPYPCHQVWSIATSPISVVASNVGERVERGIRDTQHLMRRIRTWDDPESEWSRMTAHTVAAVLTTLAFPQGSEIT